MKPKHWLDLGPSLMMGGGIILSTIIAVQTAESGWWVLAAPLFLALAFLGADTLNSRLRGETSRPSAGALILGGAILMAGMIVTLRDPELVKMLIPVIGPGFWVTLLLRPEGRSRTCRYI